MNYAFVKDNVCINIAVFDSYDDVVEIKPFSDCDDIIPAEDGFGIGDKYENGVWIKAEPIPEPPKELTEIEKLRIEQAQANAEMIDLMLTMIYGGL